MDCSWLMRERVGPPYIAFVIINPSENTDKTGQYTQCASIKVLVSFLDFILSFNEHSIAMMKVLIVTNNNLFWLWKQDVLYYIFEQ